jgi:PTH1 family peptidyl-tRNA hydrolase
MWLICGLGNPGKKYFLTRHNVGFDVVDSLIDKNNCELIKKDRKKELYKGTIDNNECLFCKPLILQTFDLYEHFGATHKRNSKFF